MRLQNILLFAALAFQYSDSKAIKPKNKNFNYKYHCSKSNGHLCSTIKKELTSAVDSISTLMEFSPAIKFDAVIDDVSKFRENTNHELFATTLNSEFTPINDEDSNIKSPYPNSKKLTKEIGTCKRNYTEDDFILLFNNFKSDQEFLKNSNKDYKNYAIKEIMKSLLTMEKLEPPYSNGYYFSYNVKSTKTESAPSTTSIARSPTPQGPPSNIIPSFDMEYLSGYSKDKDICNLIERNRNETLTYGVSNATKDGCEKRKQNKLHSIIQWKDRLISKGHPKKFSKHQHKRLVAFADIHGDYAKLLKILRHAKIIDKKNKWIAKDTIVVQTGDLVDQGDDTIQIFDLIKSLKKQAPKKNSELHLLYGNHEFFTLQGRYFYVTGKDFESFGTIANREKAFSYNGKYGKLLRNEMNVAEVINDSLFVHSGLYPEYAEMGIDKINKTMRKLLTSKLSFEDMCELKKKGKEHEFYTNPMFNGPKSPFENRNFSSLPESEICPELEKTLKLTKTKRMIVGHTVQEYGEMKTRCNDKLILLDVGMSACFGGYFGYLEMLNDKNEIWLRYNN